MAFAGTRTRGSACGCCDNCGVCLDEGDISFCLRIAGVTAGGGCAECTDLNTTYSSSSPLFPMILRYCNNCALYDASRFPNSVSSYRVCYVADYELFNAVGIFIKTVDCGIFLQRNYFIRAIMLKPNQLGMGTDTSELHVFIWRDTVNAIPDELLLLHYSYEFPSVPFDCQNVDWTAMTLEYSNPSMPTGECDWSAATLEFKFGGVCGNGSPSGDTSKCCEGTTLPASLFVTIAADGSPYQTDIEITGDQETEQYDYANGGESLTLVCQGAVDDEGEARLIFAAGTITMDVVSCSPYHAIGTASIGGVTYEAEVTE